MAKKKTPVEKEGRTVRVALALTEEESTRLKTLAEAQGLQVATYVRVVLFKALMTNEKAL